jgi:hypothetical protein
VVFCGFLSVFVIAKWSVLRNIVGFIELYKRKEILWDKIKSMMNGRKWGILKSYCRLMHESPLAKKRSVSAKPSTEMTFVNALSIFEIFSSNRMN